MDIRIKTTDFQMASDVEKYLNERIAMLERVLEDVSLARVEVELGRDAGRPRHGKNIWFAEIHVISPGSARVYARNNGETINEAIDDAKDEAVRQLQRSKQIHRRVLRKGGAMVKRLLRLGDE